MKGILPNFASSSPREPQGSLSAGGPQPITTKRAHPRSSQPCAPFTGSPNLSLAWLTNGTEPQLMLGIMAASGSPRESEINEDLAQGSPLTQVEIAVNI